MGLLPLLPSELGDVLDGLDTLVEREPSVVEDSTFQLCLRLALTASKGSFGQMKTVEVPVEKIVTREVTKSVRDTKYEQALQTQVAEAEGEVEKLKALLKGLKTQRDTAQEQVTAASGEVERLNVQVQELIEEVATTRPEVESLKQANESLLAELQKFGDLRTALLAAEFRDLRKDISFPRGGRPRCCPVCKSLDAKQVGNHPAVGHDQTCWLGSLVKLVK